MSEEDHFVFMTRVIRPLVDAGHLGNDGDEIELRSEPSSIEPMQGLITENEDRT